MNLGTKVARRVAPTQNLAWHRSMGRCGEGKQTVKGHLEPCGTQVAWRNARKGEGYFACPALYWARVFS